MTTLLRVALVAVAFVASSCTKTAPPEGPGGAVQPARVIVKLRHAGSLNPTYTDFQRDARRAGASITYVRTLHGDVHLYEIAGADTDTVGRLLQQLSAHPNVEYAEPDRIMRHQSPGAKQNKR